MKAQISLRLSRTCNCFRNLLRIHNSFKRANIHYRPKIINLHYSPKIINMSLTVTTKVTYANVSKSTDDTTLAVLGSLSSKDQQEGSIDKRKPIDLVIVLDQSGSMGGEKLRLCKATLKFLVGAGLMEDDTLGLITFDTDVHVKFPGGCKMTKKNKDVFLSVVDSLEPGSSTNLSGGLFAGLEMLLETGKADVSAICLLTDGQMNHGICDKNNLLAGAKLIVGKFGERKTPSVFTFGYGDDADATILDAIASNMSGMYYSISNVEAVPISFSDCLGGLMSVCAQNIACTCEVMGGGAEFACEPLTKFPFAKLSATSYEIKLKDMYFGEHRDLLFKIRLPKSSTATKVRLTVKYIDLANEKTALMESIVEITRNGESSVPGPDFVEVNRHVIRLESAQAMEMAKIKGLDGDILSANMLMDEQISKTARIVKEMGIDQNADSMIGEIMKDMAAAKGGLTSADMFRSKGVAQMSSAANAHYHQRSNKADDVVGNDDLDKASPYANVSKKAMMSKAKSAFGM